MSDLNLIPQEFKIQKERKTKRNVYIVITFAIILIMVGVAYIPIYFAELKNRENRKVEVEINKLSYVTDEIKKLNAQKSMLEDRINVLDSFTKSEIKWDGVITDMTALMPADVSAGNINIGKDLITMQCTAASQQSIAAFVANLQNSKEFEFSKINGITPNDKDKNFQFSVSFKYIKEESKVK